MPLPHLSIASASDLGLFGTAGSSLDAPERVLQFGTGALLRGFADVFVDDANRAGRFNGRVVMVGSTGSGRAARLAEQDGLYTLCIRGYRDGKTIDDSRIITSVSRALASQDQWSDVLACARTPDLALVISNTTEVGIQLDEDDRLDLDPPRSFPGKLTAALYERASTFDYDVGKGLVILPCELVEGNGDTLRGIVQTLAERWKLGSDFLGWLSDSVTFCNTLVDRIVPGTPDDPEALFEEVGYRDDLLTVAEPYRLWAIEGDGNLAARLPFTGLDGVVVTDDLTPYRERKVRILNGGHTSTVPAAILCGLDTVAEAVGDQAVGPFIRRAILDEIVPSLDIDPAMAEAFARDVLDRFANPFVRHALRDITFQQTAKLGVRVAPSIRGYAEKRGEAPPLLTFGVAALLAATRPGAVEGLSTDDAAAEWRARWADVDRSDPEALRTFAHNALRRWSLDTVDGVPNRVADAFVAIERDGCRPALTALLTELDS